jgi:hypothetical protein
MKVLAVEYCVSGRSRPQYGNPVPTVHVDGAVNYIENQVYLETIPKMKKC